MSITSFNHTRTLHVYYTLGCTVNQPPSPAPQWHLTWPAIKSHSVWRIHGLSPEPRSFCRTTKPDGQICRVWEGLCSTISTRLPNTRPRQLEHLTGIIMHPS